MSPRNRTEFGSKDNLFGGGKSHFFKAMSIVKDAEGNSWEDLLNQEGAPLHNGQSISEMYFSGFPTDHEPERPPRQERDAEVIPPPPVADGAENSTGEPLDNTWENMRKEGIVFDGDESEKYQKEMMYVEAKFVHAYKSKNDDEKTMWLMQNKLGQRRTR